MSLNESIVEGTLTPDGILHLDEKPALAPGRVQVVVQALPDLPEGDPFWDMMRSIWAGQKARGHIPRTADEVEAEARKMRDEWEEHQLAIEQLQIESRRNREQMS